jgi:hypothetical protein
MSNREKESLTALVWERCPSKYSGTTLVLLLKLAGLSTRDGHAFPSVKRLAMMCGVRERAVQYAVKLLKRDGLLKIQTRKGHSNRFFLQADEIRKLPLATAPNEATTPEALAAVLRDAAWFAKNFEIAVRREIPDAVIPTDWEIRWTAQLDDLFDAGHAVDLLIEVARLAVRHEWWAMQIGKDGASAFVDNFDVIRKQCEKIAPAKVEA